MQIFHPGKKIQIFPKMEFKIFFFFGPIETTIKIKIRPILFVGITTVVKN